MSGETREGHYRCANRRHYATTHDDPKSLDGPCQFAPCACWPKDGPWLHGERAYVIVSTPTPPDHA